MTYDFNDINPILLADSYKTGQWKMLPPGVEFVSSYVESRGVNLKVAPWLEKVVFFGLQGFLKKYFTIPITAAHIAEAEEFTKAHGVPFNKEGWEYIVDTHGGYLPLRIEAVPEGTVLNPKNVLVQITNTDPKCFWVPQYFETVIVMAVWYGCTVPSNTWALRKMIMGFLKDTAMSPMASIDFMLNDFGFRGASSVETAGIGGMGHLVNFKGTDTMWAAREARRLYNEPMAGFSIPASEHSTITSWGGPESEVDAFDNMINQYAGNGIFACVSDSYDIFNACENLWGGVLKDKINACKARLVVRPDSGDPLTVPIKCIEILMSKFGSTINDKGFRVLPDNVRVIQGDGVNPISIEEILTRMQTKGLSAENICFGMGGALLQDVNRDTLKFAMKMSAAQVYGEWRDVYKDPITDSGKVSKKGRLGLFQNEFGDYVTDRVENAIQYKTPNLLVPFFENGRVCVNDSLQKIRERVTLALV